MYRGGDSRSLLRSTSLHGRNHVLFSAKLDDTYVMYVFYCLKDTYVVRTQTYSIIA